MDTAVRPPGTPGSGRTATQERALTALRAQREALQAQHGKPKRKKTPSPTKHKDPRRSPKTVSVYSPSHAQSPPGSKDSLSKAKLRSLISLLDAAVPSSPDSERYPSPSPVKRQGVDVEIEEKTKTIRVLQQTLRETRENAKLQVVAAEQRGKDAMAQLEAEMEDVIERHQGMIDSLLRDKNDLASKCELLAAQNADLEAAHRLREDRLTKASSQALAAEREKLAAADKLKRERWIARHRDAIKEETIAALEPEIQRLLSKHKADLAALSSEAEVDKREALQGARSKAQEEMDALVAQHRETLLEAENDHARALASLRAQTESQVSLAVERERHAAEDHLATVVARIQSEADARVAAAQASAEEAVASARAAAQAAQESAARRHAVQLKTAREEAALELETFKRNYGKTSAKEAQAATAALRAELEAQRDAQIKRVIARLDDEAAALEAQIRAEAQETIDSSLAHLRSDLDRAHEELAEARHAAAQARAEAAQARADALDAQTELDQVTRVLAQTTGSASQSQKAMSTQITTLQAELQATRTALDAADAERTAAVTKARTDAQVAAADKIAAAHNAARVATRARDADAQAHQQRLTQLETEHAAELDRIHNHIETVLSQKDRKLADTKAGLAKARADAATYKKMLSELRLELQ